MLITLVCDAVAKASPGSLLVAGGQGAARQENETFVLEVTRSQTREKAWVSELEVKWRIHLLQPFLSLKPFLMAGREFVPSLSVERTRAQEAARCLFRNRESHRSFGQRT